METIEISSDTRRWLEQYRKTPGEDLSRTLRRVLEQAGKSRLKRPGSKLSGVPTKKERVRGMLLAGPTSLAQICSALDVSRTAAQSLVGDVGSTAGYRNESAEIDGVRYFTTKKVRR